MEFVIMSLIAVGIGVVFAIAFTKGRKSPPAKNHMREGLCFGVLAGVIVSSIFHWNVGICMSIGMVLGEFIGMAIPKETQE